MASKRQMQLFYTLTDRLEDLIDKKADCFIQERPELNLGESQEFTEEEMQQIQEDLLQTCKELLRLIEKI
jgi:hypothetical protein